MPPPNITGKLHMGHALFLTLQDSLTRFYKNSGHPALWLPGLDHAGLATYEKIIKFQKKERLSYEEAASKLSATHREIILNQITKIGALPDWSYQTYTLDPEYQSFTLKILKLLFLDGRIYLRDGNIFLNLKDLALELLEDLKTNQIDITPSYEIKNLTPFLENFEDWNISRQIPWGTPLPFKITGEILEWHDEGSGLGSLDTWFNSSLYPLASLMKHPELLEFYPAELIETGADILFFWCGKMLIMSNYIFKNQEKLGLNLKDKYAFRKIYLHGIIRDQNGEKFSKTLGNGIDPLDMIAKYGSDATRLFLATRTGPSEDIIFKEDDLIIYKKFMNKIWQSARFFSMYAAKSELEKIDSSLKINHPKLRELQDSYSNSMQKFNFLEASRMIHSEFKSFFCDQWIEENKGRIQGLDKETITEGILLLDQMLAMLEPFCPYICYEIKQQFFK